MGKYKDQHGKSRIANALEGLGEVGKPILKFIGEAVPGAKMLSNVSDMIRTSKDIEEEKKQELLELIRFDLEDLDSAREANQNIQASQFASWMAKNVPYLIDIFTCLMWGVSTLFLIAKAFKFIDQDVDMVQIMSIYMAVNSAFITILNFHRGSSMGSRMKDYLKGNERKG